MTKLKPVPRRIRAPVDGDDSGELQETIDNFFKETVDYLENKFGKNPSFDLVEIESKQMELSDNRLTYLVYNDYCVAGVFERRTEFNNLEYIFFRDLNNLDLPKFRKIS